MPRRSVLCVAATTIILALAGIGEAEDKGEFTLTAADPGSPDSTATWSGEFVLAVSADVVSGALATVPALPVSPLDAALPPCDASLCDVAKLDVALAPGTWIEDGGMLIQIQWPLIDAGYDLDLFVYGPDGSLVAQSAVWAFSRTESVWIRNPANGIYTAVIEPSLVVSQPIAPDVLTPLDYDAFVGFERALTVTRQETNNGEPYTRSFVVPGLQPDAPPVTLLPDLVPTTPTNFHLARYPEMAGIGDPLAGPEVPATATLTRVAGREVARLTPSGQKPRYGARCRGPAYPSFSRDF